MSTENIDTAVVAHLAGDVTVSSLAPGGVWFEIAPAGVASPFVIVSRRFSDDTVMMGDAEPTEEAEYLVKAVDEGTSTVTVSALAKAIRRRMEKDTYTIEDYALMACFRIGTTGPFQEDDGENIWQHRPQIFIVSAEKL